MIPVIMNIQDENDKTFVEQLYSRYSKKMYLIAENILNNREDAEDCVNETVSVIIDNLDRFRNAEGDYLIKLLVICCRNTALGIYRKNKKRHISSLTMPCGDEDDDCFEYDVPDDGYDAENLIISEENCRLLQRLIDRLDVMYRDIVMLKYYYVVTNEEIAHIMGISEALVRMRLTRARRMLIKMGGEELYDAYKR